MEISSCQAGIVDNRRKIVDMFFQFYTQHPEQFSNQLISKELKKILYINFYHMFLKINQFNQTEIPKLLIIIFKK